jgi:3'-phosphoadenosine 5'-phosphosulfate sulfotransferase (PAPS reductase)/FAD synthetase
MKNNYTGGDSNGEKTNNIDRKTDILYAKTFEFVSKVDHSIQVISRALSKMKKPYVAFSGGKDSTVLLHMVIQQMPDINVMYIDQGMEYPDTYNYIKKVWKEWNLNLSWEFPEMNLWDLYEKGAFLNPDKPTDQKTLRMFSDTVFFGPIKRYNKRIGADGFFMGLRSEESQDRKKNFEFHGELYYRSNGQLTCCPVSEWTSKDIWAYISAKKIPYNPIYDKTRFQTRNEIRVAPFGLGGTHVFHGSFVFMKYYYPELYNKFTATNQLVRKYV